MAKKEEYIFFFNSHQAWGGGERWHAETAFYLYEQKLPVVLIAQKYGSLIKRMDCKMPIMSVCLSNLSFLNIFKYVQLVRVFRQYSVKTIVLCLPIDVKVAGVAAKIAGVKNIIYRRGSAIPIKNSWYNRFLFSKILTNVIANSEATANTILQNNNNLIPREKIAVIYNGIEVPELLEKPTKNKIVIAAAGRLEHQKNFEALVEVAELLKSKNVDFVIKIAGKGGLEIELQTKINEHSLSDYVELVGFKSDLNKFFSEADIFALPSHWEGFGFVLAEAMAQELPLVAFNVSSNPELITNGENGFLVESGNINDFADKIEILINSAEMREQMGKNGRKRLLKDFSAEVANANIKNYLLNLHKD